MIGKKKSNENGFEVKKGQMKSPFDADSFVIGDIDIESSAAHKDLSVINIKAIEAVINADNKVSAYKEYCRHAAERVYDSDYAPYYVSGLKDINSKASFATLMVKHAFPDLKTAEEVVKHMTKKLELFKTLLNKYKETISSKYKELGISVSEYKKLLKDLDNCKYANVESKVFAKLKANEKSWKRDYGADFRALGGGLVFVNVETRSIWDITNVVEATYNLSCKYDVVVLVHGTNISTRHNIGEAEQKLADKIQKEMDANHLTAKDAAKKLYDSLTDAEKAILQKYNPKKLVKYYNLQTTSWEDRYGLDEMDDSMTELIKGIFYYYIDALNARKNAWGFWEPLKTSFGTYRDVNEFIRECLKRGLKKIKIMSCNPGHYEIAKDIRLLMKDNPDIDINYQLSSVLIENVDWYSNLMEPIVESFNI